MSAFLFALLMLLVGGMIGFVAGRQQRQQQRQRGRNVRLSFGGQLFEANSTDEVELLVSVADNMVTKYRERQKADSMEEAARSKAMRDALNVN